MSTDLDERAMLEKDEISGIRYLDLKAATAAAQAATRKDEATAIRGTLWFIAVFTLILCAITGGTYLHREWGEISAEDYQRLSHKFDTNQMLIEAGCPHGEFETVLLEERVNGAISGHGLSVIQSKMAGCITRARTRTTNH